MMVFEILSYFCVLTFWTVEFLYLHIIKGVEMLLLTDRFFFFFDLCQCLSFITVQRFSRFSMILMAASRAYSIFFWPTRPPRCFKILVHMIWQCSYILFASILFRQKKTYWSYWKQSVAFNLCWANL
jgi:hypothetical protein